jgi:hypothetical protein
MVTLVFRCPCCRTHCVCGVKSDDDTFAFRAGVPVPLACWVCGAHSLVVDRSAWAMLKGAKPAYFFGECLKRATECRCEAVRVQDEAARRRLWRLHGSWLSLGQRILGSDVVVPARCARVRIPPASPAGEHPMDLAR